MWRSDNICRILGNLRKMVRQSYENGQNVVLVCLVLVIIRFEFNLELIFLKAEIARAASASAISLFEKLTSAN